MGPVVWRRKARDDLASIFDYISADSPTRAESFSLQLIGIAELLGDNPRLGPARLDNLPQLRVYPYRDYVFIYRPLDVGVEIVRLIHGARDYHAIAREIADDDTE